MTDATCVPGIKDVDPNIGLHIGAIFIMGATSLSTTVFPIIVKRVPRFSVHTGLFNFAKYFGSGVIIATAFIHLLAPAIEELGNPCLHSSFQKYPFALAFSMIAIFLIFFVELISFRVGAKIAQRLCHDPHLDGVDGAGQHQINESIISKTVANSLQSQEKDSQTCSSQTTGSYEGRMPASFRENASSDLEIGSLKQNDSLTAAASEILGVVILEFGVIFHSIIIGITLGTMSGSEFKTLFIVLVFHQSFEGLGLGTRLALLPLKRTSLIPWLGAVAYACMTPIGLSIGLGIRSTYDSNSPTASYITGTFDAISSGILLYTGLVELLAHEFIFNEAMRIAPLPKVLLCVSEMLVGAALMSLLGYWA